MDSVLSKSIAKKREAKAKPGGLAGKLANAKKAMRASINGIFTGDQTLWRCGVVMRVYHSEESETRKMAEVENLRLQAKGPFEASMGADIDRRMREDEQLVIAAGGSGCGYLLDCIQNHLLYGTAPVLFLFSCRDIGLFQWFTWVVQTMQEEHAWTHRAKGGTNENDPGAKGFTVVGLTSKDVASADSHSSLTNGQVMLGRLPFTQLLAPFRNKPCHVYFQGSGGLKKAVERGCDEHGCRLVTGASYDNASNDPASKDAVHSVLKKSGWARLTKHAKGGRFEQTRVDSDHNLIEKVSKTTFASAGVAAEAQLERIHFVQETKATSAFNPHKGKGNKVAPAPDVTVTEPAAPEKDESANPTAAEEAISSEGTD